MAASEDGRHRTYHSAGNLLFSLKLCAPIFLYFLRILGFLREDSDQVGLGARGGGSALNVTLGQADFTRWLPVLVPPPIRLLLVSPIKIRRKSGTLCFHSN